LIDAAAERVPRLENPPCISVSFSLAGKQLPADHGYLLYSAISHATQRNSSPTVREGSSSRTGVPPGSPLHKADWLAIELISGLPAGRGLISLTERDANLRLRIPADHYREVLPLAGKRLDIGGHQIRLGLPVARPLSPAPSLYARVVTIKKFTEPEPFKDAVKRKLDSFGVKGRVELPLDEQGRYRRRIVTIHGKSVVGFSVAVHDLSDQDSLVLQAGAVKVIAPEDGSIKWQSIFSRRAMGCGIFNPIGSKD
jgi:CRISPR-associated protein Cas6